MSFEAVERLFGRLWGKAGFRAHPHMLRHGFASDVALLTKDPALVKEFLGDAAVSSTGVSRHARWTEMHAAVDGQARGKEAGS